MARRKRPQVNKIRGNASWVKGHLPWNTGKEWSEELRLKMSLSHKGMHLSPETEFKKGLKPWNYHLKNCFTEETLRKMRKPKSETHREKIRLNRLKQVFPKKDTDIEVALQEGLRKEGIPFRTHVPLMGQPDIFIEPNLCIFADGDYWHQRPEQIERDKRVNRYLIDKGYKIMRFWEWEINFLLSSMLEAIKETYEESKSSTSTSI